MLTFECIRFKNFLSYGNTWTEINLNKAKDTLIIGENGAGKSTFLDALSYALYMKPFRKVNNPQLVNSINGKHLAVEVEFSSGPNKYKVCRGHAPRYFEVYQNGTLLNQDAHTKDYQKILEQNILKMSYKSFTQIVVLGSRNFVPFMQLSTNDRRTVIEDLLDIQIFSTMASILKEKISENTIELSKVESNINLLEEKIILQKRYIQQLEQDKQSQRDDLLKTIADKQFEVQQLESRSEDVLRRVDPLKSIVATKDKLLEKTRTYISLEQQIETRVKTLKKKTLFFEDNNDCPTCGQELQHEFKEKAIATADESISEAQTGLDLLGAQIQTVNDRLAQVKTVEAELNDLVSQSNVLTNTAAGIISYIKSLEEHIQSTDISEETTAENRRELEQLNIDLSKVVDIRTTNRGERVVLNTAQMLLKDTGIKSRIIKQYVPIMNKLINKYLAAMEFFVEFHLDKDFKETIKSRHRDDFSYDSFSEGEKMRIDLALLFTWRAIAKMKNSASTNLLIMDEIFDSSLDSSGTDEFLKIIKELTSDTNIIIISHKTDQLLDKFSNVVKFEKHKNFSRISE
jgi:DNA repair exonuclease SbcCD ATPase subunit